MGPLKTEESPEAGPQFSPASGPDRPTPRRSWWLWLLIIAVLGYGGWRWRGASASRQAQSVGAASGARSANLSVPVVVATAQRGDLPVYFNGLGSVAAINTVTVRSRVDGQLINVAFREGQFVRQGDLLAQIDPRPFQVQLEQAEGQLAKDQAQLHDAQVNYDRFSTLYKEGVISKQQLDTQQAQVGQLEGAFKADQGQIDNAKLQLTYSRITAPISGRIGLRLIDPGNIVHVNDPNGLLIITQLQPIAVLFSLPQDQLPEVYKKLRSGVPLMVEAFARDDATKIGTGKLLTIDNQIDPSTGTYKLKAVFSNTDNSLFPNQFVNMHLLVDTKRGLTVAPAVAIQRGPQGSYVYVVANGNTAKIRPVTVALLSGNTVGISAGLQPDETVVIDGQDKLQDGSKVEPRAPPGRASPPGGKTK
jgi:membrane fusion protein, multidrug efflux system